MLCISRWCYYFREIYQEHHVRLWEVFEKLRQFNLKIEPDKCEFFKTELNYLGHVVSSEGVKPDPGKVKAIDNFSTFKNTTDANRVLP